MEFPLGRIVNHDPRSRRFRYKSEISVPKSVHHHIGAAALQQGDLGSCTGNAAAQFLNATVAKINRRTGQKLNRRRRSDFLDQPDAVDLYSAATCYDEIGGVYPPDDVGSSGLGVAKAMKRFGFITGYTHTFTFGSFLSALQAQPVLVGVNWYEGMSDPNSDGVIAVTGSVEGGHEILANGIDYRTHQVRLRNSWGPEWGRGGDCFVSFDDMERLLREDGDVVVPTLIRH